MDDKTQEKAWAEKQIKEQLLRQAGLACEFNPHEVTGKRGFVPSETFDPAEYRVHRSGKRHTDYINIMYEPKGSPLGTQHTVPKWLADAFEQLLLDAQTRDTEAL